MAGVELVDLELLLRQTSQISSCAVKATSFVTALEPSEGDGGALRRYHAEISGHRRTEWHMAGGADPRVTCALTVASL